MSCFSILLLHVFLAYSVAGCIPVMPNGVFISSDSGVSCTVSVDLKILCGGFCRPFMTFFNGIFVVLEILLQILILLVLEVK